MLIGVVGLGLIGGSLAKAIKYNTENTVLGYDIDLNVLLKAKLLGAVDGELKEDKIPECDMIITGLYPQSTKDFINANAAKFKKGAIVVDTCGVKGYVCEDMWKTAKENGFVFIGAHPMAGLHYSGFEHSQVTLFNNASMVLVPSKDVNINDLEKVKKLFLSIGFTDIQLTTPEKHDKLIAFTSQLAHVVSNAYVKSPTAKEHKGFSAGSYKDLTRVAKLNETMWTELFLENDEYLIKEIDGIIENLQQYSAALKARDEKALRQLLKDGRECKERIDGEYND
ncbi:MAG TPA: prephenate dehydrogenase/arogenate dehydrogenase family protein [Ruminococcaceae bacterium]|nr:prephenate dehydrogenase/arogenate dehydrogenase family protein [Oscillospiraceae bacterium]